LIQVGRYSANVYPKIDATMPIFACAHAFQVARSAIELIPVNMRVLLDALGTQLNCSAIVDGPMFDWRSRFDDHWGDFAHLTIQSFHNSAGAKINNTSTAANPNILLLVQNGAAVNCRKEDVRFVRVLCSLDFASLFTIVNPGLTMLCLSFYVKLPQTTVAMATAGGAAQSHHLAWRSGPINTDLRAIPHTHPRALPPAPGRAHRFDAQRLQLVGGQRRFHQDPGGHQREDSKAWLQADLSCHLWAAVPGVQRSAP